MLILQRKPGESLVIGGDISITVVSVEGGRVRLAISAPQDVPILRSELVAATAANKDSAVEETTPMELLASRSIPRPRRRINREEGACKK